MQKLRKYAIKFNRLERFINKYVCASKFSEKLLEKIKFRQRNICTDVQYIAN